MHEVLFPIRIILTPNFLGARKLHLTTTYSINESNTTQSRPLSMASRPQLSSCYNSPPKSKSKYFYIFNRFGDTIKKLKKSKKNLTV